MHVWRHLRHRISLGWDSFVERIALATTRRAATLCRIFGGSNWTALFRLFSVFSDGSCSAYCVFCSALFPPAAGEGCQPVLASGWGKTRAPWRQYALTPCAVVASLATLKSRRRLLLLLLLTVINHLEITAAYNLLLSLKFSVTFLTERLENIKR